MSDNSSVTNKTNPYCSKCGGTMFPRQLPKFGWFCPNCYDNNIEVAEVKGISSYLCQKKKEIVYKTKDRYTMALRYCEKLFRENEE